MSAYCSPCTKSFKLQRDLERHIQNSPAHRNPTQGPPQAQGLIQVRLPPVVKQQHHATSSRVKPAEPQLGLNSSCRFDTSPPTAIASSSGSPPITEPVINTVLNGGKSHWSVIPAVEYMGAFSALSAHCHTPKELEENGFIIHPYSPLDYVNSRKCKRCNSRETKTHGQECTFHPSKRNKWNPKNPYKCCKTEGKGCKTLPTHDFQLPLRATRHRESLQTPAASATESKWHAVTLDCEMAGVAGGAGEAILLCVTDYLTGALIMNRYVYPTETITQMRSSIHGVSKATLDKAVSQGKALAGWREARAELWKYIDDNTILVGHSLQHDLDALRIIHPKIVDSGILSRKAVGIHRIQWGLQTLCSDLLNVEIRKNKGDIHDCLEDVLATREVVLFCTRNKEEFRSWAEATKEKEIRLNEEREKAKQEGKVES